MRTLKLTSGFDTVSGHSWDDSPIGRQVRTVSDTAATLYRLGYYQFVPPDIVRVDWTNSVFGMTLELRFDGVAMRGSATAWTDYGGGQRANIVLRRAACPRIR